MRPIVSCLALLIALTACGGQGETTPQAEWSSFKQPATPAKAVAAPLPPACELLTTDDAKAVLQTDAGLMDDDPDACMYAGSAGVGRMTMLTLILGQGDDTATAQQMFSGIVGAHGNLLGSVNEQVGEKTRTSGQELEDLGDEAWLSSASVGGGFGPHGVGSRQLVIRKGTRLLTLNVTGTSKLAGLGERLETTARSIVARL